MKYTFTLLFISTVMAVRAQQGTGSPSGSTAYTYGFINIEDSTKNIAPVYDGAGDFSDGLVPVEKDGKWGFIDAGDRKIVAFQYDYARSFNHRQAIVQLGEYYGVINPKGEFVIPPRYYDLVPYRWCGKRYYISRDSTFFQGIIDTSGREIVPHRYTYVIPFESNLSDRKLYRNIPFYTTYREIDTAKGNFYTQFSENPFEFSPEKGRQDIYDSRFNSVSSREATSYADGFSGEELTRIDAWLDGHKTMDVDGKRTAIRRLLDEPDADTSAGPAPESAAASEAERDAQMARMGYEKFSGSDGKHGVKKNGKVLLPARFDIIKWWSMALFHPPEVELAYLEKHFAGAYKDGSEEVFLVFGIAAGSKEKGILYTMDGKEAIDITRRIPEKAVPEGFIFRTVKQDTTENRTVYQFGFVNWKGREVLPPDYAHIELLDGNRVLTKKEKQSVRRTEEHLGLYTTSGQVLIPEGIFTTIEPFPDAPNLFLAEWEDRYPTKAERKERETKNKHFVLLKVSADTYSVLQQFTASMVYTRLLDLETGMLKYQKSIPVGYVPSYLHFSGPSQSP